MQVYSLQAGLRAGQRREMGLIGLLAGLAALAVPRLGLGRLGTALRLAVMVLAAVNALCGIANFVFGFAPMADLPLTVLRQ